MSIDWKTDGEYIRRGDKAPAQFLCVDNSGAAWFKVNGHVVPRCQNGAIFDRFTDERDIIEKPKKIGGWYNVYRGGAVSGSFKSKEEATLFAASARIACVYLEFEEGQGL